MTISGNRSGAFVVQRGDVCGYKSENGTGERLWTICITQYSAAAGLRTHMLCPSQEQVCAGLVWTKASQSSAYRRHIPHCVCPRQNLNLEIANVGYSSIFSNRS